jgi:glyoxylase-like metal-dependent hydrolase (beta-lactamase superfamily II)
MSDTLDRESTMQPRAPCLLARLTACMSFAVMLASALPTYAADEIKSVRLYALDCGRIDIKNMGLFSDTGEYDGKSGALVAPCFVIRHPKGTLVWDTGLGDKLAEKKEGVDLPGGFHISVSATLADQLGKLGIAPADVTFVAFSHFHFDHTANANLFSGATWIINKRELEWALSEPTPFGVDPSTFSGYKTAKTQMIEGDYDVFGDGSVRILKAPGHTPGHQVLEVRLRKAGTYILAGDLYHTRANRQFHRIPGFNFDRAESLASIDRVEKIVHNTKGRLIVQHDPVDFKVMAKFPAYLE